jgi:hypothetical protein
MECLRQIPIITIIIITYLYVHYLTFKQLYFSFEWNIFVFSITRRFPSVIRIPGNPEHPLPQTVRMPLHSGWGKS